MKHASLLLILTIFSCLSLFAQLKTPKSSPFSRIEQTVGLSKITVAYSRPGVKGRKIFGELVDYSKVWRTGANSATTVSFSQDVKIGGKELKAGEYSLFSIPGEKEWTIIFNKETNLWGSFDYKEGEDMLRVKVPAQKLDHLVETFTIDFYNLHNNGATMSIAWEHTKVAFEIEANSKLLVEKQIDKLLIDGPSVGTLYGAARHYLENGKDLEQAFIWIEKAIEKRPNGYWMIYRKALIEEGLGKVKDAIKTTMHCRELAIADKDGDYGYTKLCDELLARLNTK